MSAPAAPHTHRGDGRCRGQDPFLLLHLLAPGLSHPHPVLGPFDPQQTAGERLSFQAAGAEAHQEVTVQGRKEGKVMCDAKVPILTA